MEIKGIIPAMVTPFDLDEQINESALRQLVDHLLNGGVHGLFPTGSQGEFYALNNYEKQKIWEIVVDQTHGLVPVYAGTGAITTREVIILNKMAEQAGVDAVSVLTPFFITPTENELYKHYVTVADATHLPIILYNNPGRTAVNLSAGLVARLAEHPNIVGIKDSSGDLSLTLAYLQQTDNTFSVLLGRDTLIYGGLLHGAKGSITATANVAPSLVVEIYEAYIEGDLSLSLAAQHKLAPLRYAFKLGTFPAVVKIALNLIGIDAGPARDPVGELTEESLGRLKDILTELEIN